MLYFDNVITEPPIKGPDQNPPEKVGEDRLGFESVVVQPGLFGAQA